MLDFQIFLPREDDLPAKSGQLQLHSSCRECNRAVSKGQGFDEGLPDCRNLLRGGSANACGELHGEEQVAPEVRRLGPSELRRLSQHEKHNNKLKRLVADLGHIEPI